MNRIRRGVDVLIVLTALASAVEIALRYDAPEVRLWFAAPAVAFVVLPLLGRHRFPFAAPATVWVVAIAVSFVDGRLVVFPISAFVGGLVASFLLGHVDDAGRTRLGLAVVLVGGALVVFNDPDHDTSQLAFIPIVFAIAWLAGFALREHAVQTEAAERRAADAERERETVVRIAVAEERARVARELHDIVAHAVSVMVLQVGAIRHKMPAELAEETDALRDVERAGRTALTEMRRLLGALRQEGEAVELTPHPGLGNLEALVAEVGRAGLPVRLHVDGETVELPEAIDRSAYRIVQEGLTNVLKHARARQADVTVRYRPDELSLEVRDDGPGASTAGGIGHGLAGIRERVKIYGGEMTAEALPERGFVLSTRLPLSGS
ncbi:sensor histidine kinase [Actinophytocola sp.]|uniref:sensor histidine kinase n=1 Tax=Actinophytocola sp. TaxID=1872138 RepID=UPI002ED4A16F